MPSFEEEAFARAQQISHSRPNGTQSERRPLRESNHNRAREPVAGHEREENPTPPKPSEPEHTEPSKPRNERKEPPKRPHTPKRGKHGLLDIFFKDKERSIIAALLLLLMDESSDPELIIALAYLLI